MAGLIEGASGSVTLYEVQRFGLLSADLESAEVMAHAWDRPVDRQADR